MIAQFRTAVLLAVLSMCPLLLAGCTDAATTTAAAYTDILINEVQSTASSVIAEDFVELYNTSSASYTFASGEWYITDSDGAPTHIFYIPASTTIAAGGYLLLLPDSTSLPTDAPSGAIYCDTTDGTNVNFGLGKSDSVSLFYTGSANSSPSTAVDSTTWTAHVCTRARVPDGGDWSSSDACTATPGATNGE